jgi:hypothetical protein
MPIFAWIILGLITGFIGNDARRVLRNSACSLTI